MFSHFGNLSFLGGMQPHPAFGMPAHYPGGFNPMPTWGANPQPIGGQFPMQPMMPAQGTMQRYPLMSGMMPGRINLGALGQSQMMRTPQAY
jgi:hypothetical protein